MGEVTCSQGGMQELYGVGQQCANKTDVRQHQNEVNFALLILQLVNPPAPLQHISVATQEPEHTGYQLTQA